MAGLFFYDLMDIRNIAIIAHVDHGKTTLVDWMLKQTHTFRDNEIEMKQTTILDRNELEREKGITILSKNTAVIYKDTKINIIDTPGHADFSGEVERVINMADGALLIIDAAEGPLPQTQFVLEKAMEQNLKIIVVINKIDRQDARPFEVLKETEELFLRLAKHTYQLEYTVLYAVGREGQAWKELPRNINDQADLSPLFDEILKKIPKPLAHENKPFKMLISTLDFDSYKGTYAIGKISQGTLSAGQNISLFDYERKIGNFKAEQVFASLGLNRIEVDKAQTGDIIAVTGLNNVSIGQTIADPAESAGFPTIKLGEPTLKITISPNTSPLSGKEAQFSTARQLEQRLIKEKKTNIGLIISRNEASRGFDVAGRGELHLSILLETLRREGYEMQVGLNDDTINFYNNSSSRGYRFKNPTGTLLDITSAGNLIAKGSITGTSKNFEIDHPAKPGYKLVHASLESPENAVFYKGEGQLQNGIAIVNLPDYFESLTATDNRTVLLTPKFDSDEPVSNLAASSVKTGKFTVRAIDNQNLSQKFYWEVKAVRRDIPPLVVEKIK